MKGILTFSPILRELYPESILREMYDISEGELLLRRLMQLFPEFKYLWK